MLLAGSENVFDNRKIKIDINSLLTLHKMELCAESKLTRTFFPYFLAHAASCYWINKKFATAFWVISNSLAAFVKGIPWPRMNEFCLVA